MKSFNKKFTVKLKVKNKISKKFKKGISFAFTLVNLHCFIIQYSVQYCSNPTIKQQIEVLVRLMSAVINLCKACASMG